MPRCRARSAPCVSRRLRVPIPGQRAVPRSASPEPRTGVTAGSRGTARGNRSEFHSCDGNRTEKRKEVSLAQRKRSNVTERRAGHALSEPTLSPSASPSPKPGAPRVTAHAWRSEPGVRVGEAGGVRPTLAPRCSSRSAPRGSPRAVPPRGAEPHTLPEAPQVAASAPLQARGRS